MFKSARTYARMRKCVSDPPQVHVRTFVRINTVRQVRIGDMLNLRLWTCSLFYHFEMFDNALRLIETKFNN